MELEHAFQQANFLVALQIVAGAALFGPAMLGEQALYVRFIKALASYTISFGPVAILVYVLYKVSQLA